MRNRDRDIYVPNVSPAIGRNRNVVAVPRMANELDGHSQEEDARKAFSKLPVSNTEPAGE